MNIIDIALDALDSFAARDGEPAIAIRDQIARITSSTLRADLADDITTIHLALDDELNDMVLIAIYDRADLDLTSLILHCDSTSTIII